jgi:hypothetical protein
MAKTMFGDEAVTTPSQTQTMFGDTAVPAQTMFGDTAVPAPTQPEEEVGTFEDIARGALSGITRIPQGIVELGASGIDAAFDTNTSREVTESFEELRDTLGIEPEGTAGKVTESIVNFAGAAIPVIGWLSRASRVAQGGKVLESKSRLGRAAERLGESKTGKTLLGSRPRQAATTSVAAGAADFFVATDGQATISDGFDALPEDLKTEEDVGLFGRDEAARRLRNKLRVGVEGTALAGAFEAIFPVVGGTVRGLSQTPGVNTLANIVNKGFDKLGDKFNESTNLKKWFTSAGLVPKDIYEDVTTTEAFVDELTDIAAKNFTTFDKELKKVVKGQGLFGRGKQGINKAYDDLFRFLEGEEQALDEYGKEVVSSGQVMRDQIDGLSDLIAKQIDELPDQLVNAKEKQKILAEFAKNRGSYVRRIYEGALDPKKVVDGSIRETTEYKQAVEEVLTAMKSPTKKTGKKKKKSRTDEELRAEAQLFVDRQLTGDMVNLDLDPLQALRNQKESFDAGARQLQEGPRRQLYNISEGLLQDRIKLLDESPTLRAMLKQVTDPKEIYLRTVGDLSNFFAGNNLYTNIAKNFREDIDSALTKINAGGRPLVVSGFNISDKQAAELVKQGYKKLGEFNSKSAFGGAYGTLTGSYVAPEVYNGLTVPIRAQNGLQEALAVSLQAKGLSQMAKTVLNPLAQVRNFLSGSFFLGANANVVRNMELNDSWRLTWGKAADLADDDFKEFYNLTGRLGIRDQNIQVNEFRQLLQEGKTLEFSGQAAAGLQSILDKTPGVRALQKVYSGTDTFWKVAGLLGERAKYTAAFKKSGLNVDELDSEVIDGLVAAGIAPRKAGLSGVLDDASFLDLFASDIVKKTMPVYSRVPESIKAIRRVPLIGNFIAFPAEIIRNTSNIFNQGVKELSFKATPKMIKKIGPKNARQLEKEIRAIGAGRLTAYVSSAYAIPLAAQKSAMRLTDTSEEEMNALQKVVPEYMRGHVLIPLEKSKDGKMQYIDFSYMNPYDFALAPARQALRVYGEKGEVSENEVANLSAGLFQGIKTFFEPFAGESLIAERLQDVLPQNYFGRGGKTGFGAEIYGKSESSGEQLRKSFNHILGGFNPGLVEQFVLERGGEFVPGRVTRALADIPGRQGQESTGKEELLTAFTGFRRMDVDLPNTLFYRGYEYTDLRSDAVGNFSSIAKRNDSTEEEIVNAYKRTNEDLFRAQAQLKQVVDAARELGMSDQKIRFALKKQTGMGNRELNAVMRGKFEPFRVSGKVRQDIAREANYLKQPRIVTRLPNTELFDIARELRGRDLTVQEPEEMPENLFVPETTIQTPAPAQSVAPTPTQPQAVAPVQAPVAAPTQAVAAIPRTSPTLVPNLRTQQLAQDLETRRG